MQRLALLDDRLSKTAGSDDEVAALVEERPELVEFADGRLLVRVDEPNDASARQAYALADAAALAAAFRVADHGKPWDRGDQGRCRFASAIVPIGRDDDFARL